MMRLPCRISLNKPLPGAMAQRAEVPLASLWASEQMRGRKAGFSVGCGHVLVLCPPALSSHA